MARGRSIFTHSSMICSLYRLVSSRGAAKPPSRTTRRATKEDTTVHVMVGIIVQPKASKRAENPEALDYSRKSGSKGALRRSAGHICEDPTNAHIESGNVHTPI